MKTNNLMLQFCRVTTFAAELPLTNSMTHHSVHCTNLCSKRLSVGVEKERKTEEWGFLMFWLREKNGARAIKRNEGEGGEE